jgi:hypothetical protein
VTPNRRGVKSRELVLDAVERVIAEHGFEAAAPRRTDDRRLRDAPGSVQNHRAGHVY